VIKNQLLKPKNIKIDGNFSTQRAGFQLAGPAADVSKILYGENRKSYPSPNALYSFDWCPIFPRCEGAV
jgi:hypothetical protein